MLRLDLIVGPNGAGKSTFARTVLCPVLPGALFVNADEIAAERWPGEEEAHGYEAAALAEATRRGLIEASASFVAETVFSHPSKLDLIRRAKAAHYTAILHVLVVPKKMSRLRVEQRVAEGGHSVPLEKIDARYDRIWPLVSEAIELVDQATIYDSSAEGSPRVVVRVYDGSVVGAINWPPWAPAVLTERWAIAG